jgi:hypothetical protein
VLKNGALMSHTGPPLDYGRNEPGRAPRTFLIWLKITLVWCVGLAIWTAYLAAILYMLYRIM